MVVDVHLGQHLMKVLFLYFTDPPRPFSSSVAALAGVVRDAGHEAVALEVLRTRRIEDVAREVDAVGADILGISAMSRDWPGAAALLARLRSQPFVVVGGYHASLAPHDVAQSPHVNAIVLGEGERPMARLLDGLPLTSSSGLWVRGPAGFEGEPPSANPEPDINALPRWNYDVFGDTRASLDQGLNTFGPRVDRYLPTRASRGCPYSCAYCSAPTWGAMMGFSRAAMVNLRSVDCLIDEHQRLKREYAPEGFEFWDEHFPVSIAWLREFAEKYPAKVGLPFKVEMHPNAATQERLALLAQAGCSLFHCGIEAGDATLRRETLNRRTSDATLQRVFDDARALGLETSASLMTQLPGETRAQASETLGLVRRLRPGSFMWSTYQPLPGTPLGDAARETQPGPSRERFDDFDEPTSRTPALQDEAEQAATFAELRQAQQEAAGTGKQARPVEIPEVERVSPALDALLGVACVGIHWEQDVLHLWLPSGRAEICDVSSVERAYRKTRALALSYRGNDIDGGSRKALDVLVGNLKHVDIEALRRASASE